MKIFIDGDALPNLLKPVLLKAINKNQIETYVISNKRIFMGDSQYIQSIIVGGEIDEADDKIVEMVEQDDLVITGDIPLADRVLVKKANAIDHRGGMFNDDNIKQFLSTRALMKEMRDIGMVSQGGGLSFGPKDVQAFANRFNQILAQRLD